MICAGNNWIIWVNSLCRQYLWAERWRTVEKRARQKSEGGEDIFILNHPDISQKQPTAPQSHWYWPRCDPATTETWEQFLIFPEGTTSNRQVGWLILIKQLLQLKMWSRTLSYNRPSWALSLVVFYLVSQYSQSCWGAIYPSIVSPLGIVNFLGKSSLEISGTTFPLRGTLCRGHGTSPMDFSHASFTLPVIGPHRLLFSPF